MENLIRKAFKDSPKATLEIELERFENMLFTGDYKVSTAWVKTSIRVIKEFINVK